MVVIGAVLVVVGGLVAAVTGPLQLDHGSWLAAYLVLVGGAAQVSIGRAPTWLRLRTSPRGGWWELMGWNVGNLAVVVGTLTTAPFVVDAGGVILLLVLVLLLREALVGAGDAGPSAGRRWARWGYAVMLAVLVVSVPIGLVLAHLRAS